MEDMQVQEKPGLFGRLANIFTRTDEVEEEVDETEGRPANALTLKAAYRYQIF